MSAESRILKIEIDECCVTDAKIMNGEAEKQTVEVEILSPKETDSRRLDIYHNICEVDESINSLSEQIDKLNAKVDSLTNHAEGRDYTVAIASGLLTGVLDSFFVGELPIHQINQVGNEKVENFVVSVAQKKGFSGSDLPHAIKFLEEKFPIIADKASNDFGGGLQHHLRDFSHHPTPVGLLVSMLTQFTGKVYGTDVAGMFKAVPVDTSELIGTNLSEKMTFGVINWLFHMVSDMAGSSSSAMNGALGTGIPGPLVSLLKELSVLPLFRNMNEKDYKEFSVWISKLFNGTLLGDRDETGKLIRAAKFDLRTEIGLIYELDKQAIPVVLNDCIVRGFYFVTRLAEELKEKKIEHVSDLKKISWKKVLPFNNRTVTRMLTVSTSTFMACDLVDAAIRFNNISTPYILRLNFVGCGRFAIAISTDTVQGIKRARMQNKRLVAKSKELNLLNAKLFYKEADMWIEAENTESALKKVFLLRNQVANEFGETWDEISEGSARRKKGINNIRTKNDAFANELSELLEWGI